VIERRRGKGIVEGGVGGPGEAESREVTDPTEEAELLRGHTTRRESKLMMGRYGTIVLGAWSWMRGGRG
jgi:hypothetical protein